MNNSKPMARRWDPIVKITHWGIAAAVVVNALIVGEGSIAHIYAGYSLAALLGLRLLWGLVGPTSARFASFPPSPAGALAHMRDIVARRKEQHISHNPLGALMAYALWACLGVIIASGIAMAGPPPAIDYPVTASELMQGEGEGDEERYEAERGQVGAEREEGPRGEEGEEGEKGEEIFEEVHEVAVNLLYVLIFLHIAGVLFETMRSGRRTIGAMLPGGK